MKDIRDKEVKLQKHSTSTLDNDDVDHDDWLLPYSTTLPTQKECMVLN
jgi:hypothetical protein